MLAPAKPRLCPSTRSRAHRGAQRHPAAMPGASVAALPCSLSAQSQTPQGNFGRSRRFPAERTADGEVLIRNPATSSAGKKKREKKAALVNRAGQHSSSVLWLGPTSLALGMLSLTHPHHQGHGSSWSLLVPLCSPCGCCQGTQRCAQARAGTQQPGSPSPHCPRLGCSQDANVHLAGGRLAGSKIPQS